MSAYDPELGIFLSTDPQDVFWNSFFYCGGDPLYFVDPDGENPVAWFIAGIVMLYAGFSIKNQVNGMDPSDAWNPFAKDGIWWTGEEGKEGTGALTSLPRNEFGVDSDRGPYYDVGGNRSYPVYDSKRKRIDQKLINDFNNKANNITQNVTPMIPVPDPNRDIDPPIMLAGNGNKVVTNAGELAYNWAYWEYNLGSQNYTNQTGDPYGWKCNIFVGDAYTTGAGIQFPTYPSGRYITANDIGNPNYSLPTHWTRFSYPSMVTPRKGDVFGFNRYPNTGHAAMYAGNNYVISARQYGIRKDPISSFAGTGVRTYFIRYYWFQF